MQLVAVQPTNQKNEYQRLKRILTDAGLFERQPLYYVSQFALTAGLVVVSVALVLLVDSFWLRMPVAALMALTSGQIGFLGHDLGHRQVFRSKTHNDWVMLAISPLVGVSPGWWRDAHNRHHSTPNDLERDPHTTIPVLAFSEGQVSSKPAVLGFMVRYQWLYFVPLLMVSIIGTKANGVVMMVQRKLRYLPVEVFGFLLHLVLYVGFLFSVLPLLDALVLAAVHHVLTGLYFGMMFAPNHKGMAVFSDDNRPDFLRSQVLTSRNMHPHPVTDYLFGGLNYQIEHHLFPTMPRNKLGEARPIVRAFCQGEGIDYYETSVFQSYKEVFVYLKQVTDKPPLRT